MTARAGQFGNEEVVKQGYLRRLKTGKKRYFVLKRPTRNGKGRMEYHASYKKYSMKSHPKRCIYMKDCLTICKIQEKKYANCFALFTKVEKFGLVAESQEEIESWLSALELVRKECFEMEESLKYDQVWSIKIKDEGIGRTQNLHGNYQLGLQGNVLLVLKPPSYEVLHEIHLNNIRRSGQKDRFFFMELGRKGTLGPGELWIEAEEICIAEHMKHVIFRSSDGRPRSLTDGSGKDKIQPTGAYNRSISQCENNRNMIGSNFGTLKVPSLDYNDDISGYTEHVSDTNLRQSPTMSPARGGNLRRPATVDFDAVLFDTMSADVGTKRLTVSTADLVDASTLDTHDSDDNIPSDEDDSLNTDVMANGLETEYVAMRYPHEVDSRIQDHYTYVVPVKPEGNSCSSKQGDELSDEAYVSMTGDDVDLILGSDGKMHVGSDAEQVQPYYSNLGRLAKEHERREKLVTNSSVDSESDAESTYSNLVPAQAYGATLSSTYSAVPTSVENEMPNMTYSNLSPLSLLTRATQDPTYTNVPPQLPERSSPFSSKNAGDDVLMGKSGTPTLNTKLKNKIKGLPKSLTLSPQLQRSAKSRTGQGRKLNIPSSCFYVESPVNSVSYEEVIVEGNRKVKSSLSDGELTPSYVNIPKYEVISAQTEWVKIERKPKPQSHKAFESNPGQSRLKEQVKLKGRSRSDLVRSGNHSVDTVKESFYPSLSFDPNNRFRSKGVVKQSSLTDQEPTAIHVSRKASAPSRADYVNVPKFDRDELRSSGGNHVTLDRAKTRQYKTTQTVGRGQLYDEFVLPKARKKRSNPLPAETKYDDTKLLTRDRSLPRDVVAASDLQDHSNSKLIMSGKSMSYENLFEDHCQFQDKNKPTRELSYADIDMIEPVPNSPNRALEGGPPGTHLRRLRFKMSKSCDSLLSVVDKESPDVLKELNLLDLADSKDITYMEVDIERSQGVAEAVREQRAHQDFDIYEASV